MQSVFFFLLPLLIDVDNDDDDNDDSFDPAGLLTPFHSLSAAYRYEGIMKVAVLFLALCASLASAAVVKTPVFDDQIVPNQGDDCALGVTTPQGCA